MGKMLEFIIYAVLIVVDGIRFGIHIRIWIHIRSIWNTLCIHRRKCGKQSADKCSKK